MNAPATTTAFGAARTAAPERYLELRSLTKRYDGKAVVEGVSLSVDRGEVLTILGPSGCGKTTTLKIIAGFLEPDGGSVVMGGRAVDTLTSHQRGAAMVFQNYALFPHMTVRRNVAFGLRMRRLGKREIAERVGAMLERVGLAEFGERFPRELSGGQQQRVALARALIIRPNILLLDEPFSSLDAKLRKQLRAEFLEIHRAFQITSVFVTHDLEEAFAISDKVAVMNAGRLEQAGSPSSIFSRPASRFVADFVGHKNLVDGAVAADGATFTADGIEMRIGGAGPGRALVSVPIHRVRAARGPLGTDNAYPAVVEDVAFLGPVIQARYRVGGRILESYGSSTPELEALGEGDHVSVGWNAGDVIVIGDGR